MLSLHFVGKCVRVYVCVCVCVCVRERESTNFTAVVSVYLHSAHYNEIKL